MPIRAKHYAAIAITVLGPLVTITVAFAGFSSMGTRFNEVARRLGLMMWADVTYRRLKLCGMRTGSGTM